MWQGSINNIGNSGGRIKDNLHNYLILKEEDHVYNTVWWQQQYKEYDILDSISVSNTIVLIVNWTQWFLWVTFFFVLGSFCATPNLQRVHRQQFHLTLYWAWDYLSVLGFKLIHVSKGALDNYAS